MIAELIYVTFRPFLTGGHLILLIMSLEDINAEFVCQYGTVPVIPFLMLVNIIPFLKQAYFEMSSILRELNEKKLEVKELQVDLNRRESTKSDDDVEGLKRIIAKLEKEKSTLEVGESFLVFGWDK